MGQQWHRACSSLLLTSHGRVALGRKVQCVPPPPVLHRQLRGDAAAATATAWEDQGVRSTMWHTHGGAVVCGVCTVQQRAEVVRAAVERRAHYAVPALLAEGLGGGTRPAVSDRRRGVRGGFGSLDGGPYGGTSVRWLRSSGEWQTGKSGTSNTTRSTPRAGCVRSGGQTTTASISPRAGCENGGGLAARSLMVEHNQMDGAPGRGRGWRLGPACPRPGCGACRRAGSPRAGSGPLRAGRLSAPPGSGHSRRL